jgi:cytochrome c-type biogenesis protein CcmH/NrfG
MALSKFSTNLIFAAMVAALGLTAVIFYFKSNRQQVQVQVQAADSSQLPEKHPPVDLAGRIAALQQMSAREPQNPDYPAQIGNLYYDSGQYAKAAEFYQQSLNIHPRDPNVETDLATCFHYMGQDDRSLKLLDNVLEYNPSFTQAKLNKGIVLIEGKKDVKGGISVWEDLLRSDPGYAQRAELEQKILQLKASIR